MGSPVTTISALRARREPVSKTIGSVTFEDPYAWLSKDSPEALAWQWRQNDVAQNEARSWPGFEKLKAQVAASGSALEAFTRSPPRCIASKWFWMAPGRTCDARTLWTFTDATQQGHPVFETDQGIPGSQQPARIVFWYEPSPNAQFVAVAMGPQSMESGEWRVVEVATGRLLPARASAQLYTGAMPGWLKDSSGFYCSDRTADGRHRLRFVPVLPGTQPRPDVVFEYSEVPAKVPGLTPEVSPDGRWIIALSGLHERIAYMIGDTATGKWRKFLPEDYEGECGGAWLDADTYVARSHTEDFPRGRIVAIPVATSTDMKTWREVQPQTKAVLRAVGVVGKRIIVADVLDVSTRFRTLASDGSEERIVPVEGPGNSLIASVARRFEPSEMLGFDYQTFTRSTAIYSLDVETNRLTTVVPSQRALDGITVTQRFATSPDGARVPYFLVHRSDVSFDKPQPAILTGYGGFNAALMPSYLAHMTPFVQAGGVFIHANLRGGAEYGKHWHEAGRLACKWNTFLDLFAVAEHVIAEGVTSSDKLAMTGVSNGGLLAGVAIAHRPDLWRAVVPVVPLFDQMEPLPLDPQYDAIRAYFLEDYGDARHPVMSKVLYSYSPYHNVRDDVAYPAVFQVFGEKDSGCLPFHGRKFTARLQAATSSDRPILLRVWKDTGHTAFGETEILQASEYLSFIMRELGMEPA